MIYFDNSSTTKPCKTAVEYMNRALESNWGNPSSLHTLGIAAEEEISLARAAVAKMLGAEDDTVFFTSSGTEANNIAILGAANARKKRGNRIVTTAIEHPSVMETINSLKLQGFEVITLFPKENGVINHEELKQAINGQTILVSIMLVNNETGAIQPVEKAAQYIKECAAPALLHCDGVQAFGKMPISVKKLGVDLFTASGHKIHASKGVGVLYRKKGVHIVSPVFGGGQEKGVRSGTENVAAIASLCGALKELPDVEKQLIKQKELWEYAKEKLLQTGLVSINSSNDALPYILNISMNSYRSETVLHYLDAKGIYISSGSACAKGHKSYVMKNCGFDDKRIDSALRLSFNHSNTKEEIDIFCEALISAGKILRKA